MGRSPNLSWSRHESRVTLHDACVAKTLVFLLVALFVFGCSSDPPRPSGSYTVKKGDTLYSIAWRNSLDYRELAKWNDIGRDYAIHPGQVLRLSSRGATAATRKTTSTPSAPNNASQSSTAARGPANTSPPVKWLWPVSNGSVQLTTRPNGGKGLTIGGALGQEIHAAAAGRVVYTGSGLLGYGQLVIIQHNDSYLSAYGHTQTVRVHEQESVKAGQVIAAMGAGPNGSPMLYFEIRVNGRPTDPTPLLPK